MRFADGEVADQVWVTTSRACAGDRLDYIASHHGGQLDPVAAHAGAREEFVK